MSVRICVVDMYHITVNVVTANIMIKLQATILANKKFHTFFSFLDDLAIFILAALVSILYDIWMDG